MIPRSIAVLTDALAEQDSQTRRLSAWTLGDLGPLAKPAVPALIRALDDRDPEVRREVAAALGQLGPEAKAAVKPLRDALNDRNLRLHAAVALLQISPTDESVALAVLDDVLRASDDETQFYIVTILGELGPRAKGAVPALLRVFNEVRAVRDAAAVALKKIDPETARRALSRQPRQVP
jgi:HEAT repeat protein